MAKLSATAFGKVITDIEYEVKENGLKIAKFSMPLDAGKKLEDGTYPPTAAWIKVTAFGQKAEYINNYLKKGDNVIIIGDTKISTYVSQKGQSQGNAMASVEIVASVVNIISQNQGQNHDAGQGQQNNQQSNNTGQPN